MKMVKLKIITIVLIISLGCLAKHYTAKKDLDEFRHRMVINEQIRQQNHMDSVYTSIQNSLDSIQIMLDIIKKRDY